MLTNFVEAVNQKKESDRDRQWRAYRQQAVRSKESLVNAYKKYFPLLCESLNLNEGEPVWLAKGDESNARVGLSGYGASGVLVDGFIFAIHGNSYCTSFVVGIYEGEGVDVSTRIEILSDGLDHDEKLAAWIQQNMSKQS
jgi:hypothetical protein